jgi:hypothetical protein
LAELGQNRDWQGEEWFGVYSAGVFFPMTRAATLEGL